MFICSARWRLLAMRMANCSHGAMGLAPVLAGHPSVVDHAEGRMDQRRSRPWPSWQANPPANRAKRGLGQGIVIWRRPARRRPRRPAPSPACAVGHAGGGVGDLGEAAEQATALVGRKRSGRSQLLGNSEDGGCGAGRRGGPEGHGLGYPHDRGEPCLSAHPPGTLRCQ
jgi:hypothetical protein